VQPGNAVEATGVLMGKSMVTKQHDLNKKGREAPAASVVFPSGGLSAADQPFSIRKTDRIFTFYWVIF
jgi:hypothetical protein